jgi:hypothetical protein
MTAIALNKQLATDVTEAAKLIGKRGGRPKGSCSSPLAAWLRNEVKQRQREGYRCREAFEILRESEEPASKNSFTVTDWTADSHLLDIAAEVTWANYRKVWNRTGQ